MGVPGLFRFLNDLCVSVGINAITKNSFGYYKGKMVAVDTLQKLFSYGIAIRNSGADKKSTNGHIINHIYAVTYYTRFLIKNKIKPFYVFEGNSPAIKSDTTDERRQKKYNAKKKCIEIEDKTSDEYIKNFKRGYTVTSEDIKECQHLLEAFGIPYVEAAGEADSQCAALVLGDSDFHAAITEDIDVLVFGTNRMLKDFSGKNEMATEISHKQLMQALLLAANNIRADTNLPMFQSFTYENFIDFVSLLETDYSTGIKSPSHSILFKDFVINNMNVVELIEHIEEINKDLTKKYNIPANFWEKWEEVRQYYLTAEVVKPENIDKTLRRPNRTAIFNILHKQCKFDERDVDKLIAELDDFYFSHNKIEPSDSQHLYSSFSSYQAKYNQAKYNQNQSQYNQTQFQTKKNYKTFTRSIKK